VFAAASLAESFAELSRLFERGHAGVLVQLNLAGSQQLASQIDQGARADVFASADERWMEDLERKALLEGGAIGFAGNRLVVIVPRANPGRIGRLQDLARRGVKIVLGAQSVPVGQYARQVLDKLSHREGFDPGFARRVLANLVSEEENVKSVVGKIQLGEADAGLVYRSDVTPAVSRDARVLDLPQDANVLVRYPIAVLAGSSRPGLAHEFVKLVLSAEGQKVLRSHGFVAPPARAR
jgi:molybdate transport system substrate-binding protein